MFDPLVPASMTKTMWEICFSVAIGYHHYVTATVDAGKLAQLVQKWQERFDVAMLPDRRHRERKCNAVFRLHLFPLPNTNQVFAILLRTDGDHPCLSLERWTDARKSPLQWPWWYELVRLPRPVYAQEKLQGDKAKPVKSVGWTWRINRRDYDGIRSYVVAVVHRSDQRLQSVVNSLRCAPGFRGIRNDVKEIYELIRRVCRKQNRALPEIPATIRWVTPRFVRRVPLSKILRRAQRGACSWFPQQKPAGFALPDTSDVEPSTEGDEDETDATEATNDPSADEPDAHD